MRTFLARLHDGIEFALARLHLFDREVDEQDRVLRHDPQKEQQTHQDGHGIGLSDEPYQQYAPKRRKRQRCHIDERAHQALVKQDEDSEDQQDTGHERDAIPLLRSLLEMVIQDEARHVHYGVLALREHFTKELSERERREREDWAFEVALLMRNRFMVYEVYEEWFEGIMSREHWRRFIMNAPGMQMFRRVMFSRLVPNLRAIGLMSERILPYYDKAGLLQYFDGLAADHLTAEQLISDLDSEVAF